MKACTFTPEVVNTNIMFSEHTEVKGLDIFLENQEKARRIADEKKEREDKVFFKNLKELDPDQHYTIPQPFELHPSTRNVKVNKLKAELHEKEIRECTFQPQTTEARNRSTINRLIDTHSTASYPRYS